MTLLFSTRHSAFSPHPCNHCDRSDIGIRTVGPLHRNYVFSRRRLRPRRCAATPVLHFETVLGVRVTLLNAFLLVEIIYAGWKFNYVELFGVRTRAYARIRAQNCTLGVWTVQRMRAHEVWIQLYRVVMATDSISTTCGNYTGDLSISLKTSYRKISLRLQTAWLLGNACQNSKRYDNLN